MVKRFKMIFFIFLTLSITAFSQENTTVNNGEEEFESMYHISTFTGFTNNFEHNTNDFTLGLDYEQKLPFMNNMFGVGVIVEAVFTDLKENIFAIPIYIHLGLGGTKFFLAPGVIFGEQEIVRNSENKFVKYENQIQSSEVLQDTETYQSALFRIGTSYDFHLDMFSISPTIGFDFYNGVSTVVYGINLGMSL